MAFTIAQAWLKLSLCKEFAIIVPAFMKIFVNIQFCILKKMHQLCKHYIIVSLDLSTDETKYFPLYLIMCLKLNMGTKQTDSKQKVLKV